MGVGEVQRLKQLEEENRKLKQLVADLSLDKHMPQDVLSKSSEACCTARIGAGAEVLLCHLRAPGVPAAELQPQFFPLPE